MNKSYRLKANVGSDQVLNVDLKQDVDIYEILSLKLGKNKLSQNGISVENTYKTHSAGYGVIVGRVLANDAFGVPNVKVSVFLPLTDEDKLRRDLRTIYPYSFVTDTDSRGVKYNTLPNYKRFTCHQPVGSFPNKRLVLDEDSILELYDKYYKYTTITNNAGDYMIFGVPTGEQILHVDVDLSDIGILSQEPRDFIYKGYSINLFESPTQFKKSSNLDDLPQIQSQSTSVTVYPLWGDKNSNEIAITRKDITLQYKFEPTCVFIGSVVTDNGTNSVSHNCIPDEEVGEANQLVSSKGNIEMIRKTIEDRVEEYPIKGNQLIDADGTWCYQIPMNLDYIGTDEYGNVVPTNNPNKGIPTRSRVRFRITLDESGSNTLTTHTARYLIPNNPDLYEGNLRPCVKKHILDNDSYYEFGTLTPDECFRDLYWNKVYSVKNYIPRVQMSAYESTTNYLAIKGVNKNGAKKNNLIPYNKLNANLSLPAYMLAQYTQEANSQSWYGFLWNFFRWYSPQFNNDNILENAVEEMDGISLDFYNDWLNGCLYFPSWFWHVRQKKNYKKGESIYESSFCECKRDTNINMPSELYIYNNASLFYDNDDLVVDGVNVNNNQFQKRYTKIPYGSKRINSGIIKKMINKDGAEAFYYSFGNSLVAKEGENDGIGGNTIYDGVFPEGIRPSENEKYYLYARLFSTDIILLGSLKDNDIDGVPMVQYNLPSTTAIIPPIGRYKNPYLEMYTVGGVPVGNNSGTDEENETEFISYNGMNWGKAWYSQEKQPFTIYDLFKNPTAVSKRGKEFKYHLGSGLFFGIGIDSGLVNVFSDIKSPVNIERICELGVTYDSDTIMPFDEKLEYYNEMDGLITKRELEDVESRALFASLNYNKLIGTVENYNTGYKKYNIINLFPSNFDGRLEEIAPRYSVDETQTEASEKEPITYDYRNKDYLDFRFGSNARLVQNNLIRWPNNVSYRSLENWFNGKRTPWRHINNVNPTTIIKNGEYINYYLDNGIVKFEKFVTPRLRHFYGYDKNFDTVIPKFQTEVGNISGYTFPLYDNSFYFYFGLNEGSTAIDKFYEQFYTECKEEKSDAFIVNYTAYPSVTSGDDGYIIFNVQEITKPYSIEIRRDTDNVIIRTKENINETEVTVDGIPNGKYIARVIDNYGNFVDVEIIVEYEKVELNYTVERSIMVTYYGAYQRNTICNNNLYGILKFNSFSLYGKEYEIESIEPKGNGKYKLNNNDKSVLITITPNGNEYFCGNVGSEFHVCQPAFFTVKVCELRDDTETENISYYYIKVGDTHDLEMYVNDVPLKYIVGKDEKKLPYNKYFHGDGHAVEGISDESIKGWFGTHNPSVYSDIFNANMSATQTDYEINSNIWFKDIGSKKNIDIIKYKLNYMFRLSNGAYVTNGNKNKFSVTLHGGSGDLLLRSAMPIYEEFSNKYVTGERNTAICNEKYPNIVSENYTELNNSVKAFNPRYTNSNVNAGNYFAGFSENANIIQIDDTNCRLWEDGPDYQVIPFKAKPITGLCLHGEENEIKSDVYNKEKYFRTEFIDRRFDYDAVIITAHKCNHYGEQEGTWSRGRLSALTYNGIEMLYDDNKSIISTGNNTEYKYNIDTAEVTLNSSSNKPKRFYDSKLYYENNSAIDLTNAYYYKGNSNPYAEGVIMVTSHTITENDFDYFGLTTDGTVKGYPSKRWLDFYGFPYSDRYTLKTISCSYNGIEVDNSDGENVKAYALPGENTSFTVDGNEIVNLIPPEMNQNEYNIWFEKSDGQYIAKKIESIKFKILPEYINGDFNTYTNKIVVIPDTSEHSKLVDIKTTTAAVSLDGITATTLTPNYSTIIDTSESFKDIIFNVTGNVVTDDDDANYSYLVVAVDRSFKNAKGDFLTKKITLINTSTIYNVSSFGFECVLTEQKDYCNFKITSKYIANQLGDMKIYITASNVTALYSLENGIIDFSKDTTNGIITFKISMQQHTSVENGTFKCYLKIKDGIKAVDGEGYLIYSFEGSF